LGTVGVVLLLGVALLAGFVIGRSIPPGPRHVAGMRVRWWGLVPAGVGLAGLAGRLDGALAVVIVIAGLGALVAFTSRNLQMAGMGVLTIGLVLNLVAVLVNAGMPVRPASLVSAGVVDSAGDVDDSALTGYRHVEHPGERLPALGDVIPVPFGTTVVSFGDIVIAFGVADVVAHLVRRRRRNERGQVARADLRHWIPPDEVAKAALGGADPGVDPIWRDDLELFDADIDLGNTPRDRTDPDITVPLRVMRSRRTDRAATRRSDE
jgi:Family of unknown function (DUF5317)